MRLYTFLGVASLVLWLFVLYLELKCAFLDTNISWPLIAIVVSIVPTTAFYRLDKKYSKHL